MLEFRTLAGLVVPAVATLTVALAGTSTASASTRCAGHKSFVTNGGYDVKLDRYRSLAPYEHSEGEQQMKCSSVRYVTRFLRHKIQRQWRWPHISGPFYDGYVTWDCFKRSRYHWECDEYESGIAALTQWARSSVATVGSG
jgi:hypothetical protein